MSPEELKSWSDALTAPAVLVVLCLGLVSLGKYFARRFVDPLGGPDGKIALFVDGVRESIRNIPEALRSMEVAFREIGEANQAILLDLQTKTKTYASALDSTQKDVRKLIRVSRRACDAVREVGEKLHPEHMELLDRHLHEIENILESRDQ